MLHIRDFCLGFFSQHFPFNPLRFSALFLLRNGCSREIDAGLPFASLLIPSYPVFMDGGRRRDDASDGRTDGRRVDRRNAFTHTHDETADGAHKTFDLLRGDFLDAERRQMCRCAVLRDINCSKSTHGCLVSELSNTIWGTMFNNESRNAASKSRGTGCTTGWGQTGTEGLRCGAKHGRAHARTASGSAGGSMSGRR